MGIGMDNEGGHGGRRSGLSDSSSTLGSRPSPFSPSIARFTDTLPYQVHSLCLCLSLNIFKFYPSSIFSSLLQVSTFPLIVLDDL